MRRVVDRSHAGLGGVERSRLAHRVYANVGAQAMRFFHGGSELRSRVLVGRLQSQAAVPVGNHAVFPRLVDLGEIGSFFVLRAHHFDDLVGSIGVVGVGEHVLGGVIADRVFVAARIDQSHCR